MAKLKLPRLTDFNTPKKRLKLFLYSGALFIGISFVTALSLPLISNPTLCGNICHATTREYYAWKKSSHSNVSCDSCHSKLGQIAYLFEKIIDSPRYTFVALTQNYKRPINVNGHVGRDMIPNENCERCHNMQNRNVSPSRIFSKKMYGKGDKYHDKHIRKKIPCTICHNRIAHKDVNEPEILKKAGYDPNGKEANTEYINGLNMREGCFRCHAPDPSKRDKDLVEKYQAQKAPKYCTNCHVKSILPIGHKNNDWRTDHPKYAKKNLKYCLRCHNSSARFNFEDKIYCTRCHAEHLVNKWL